MYYTLQQRIAHILRAIIAWAFAYAFFGVIRLYGIAELPHIIAIGKIELEAFVLQLSLAAVITGLMYGIVDVFLDRPVIQRLPYGAILSLRICLHILIVLVVLVTLVYSRVKLGIISEGYFDPEVPRRLWSIIFNKSFYVFVLFFGVVSTTLDFYQQVKHKFGRGVFLDIFLGRYHKPKESERIFTFIDLKSSVGLAEELGHIQYSNLLQDCFFDLNTQLSKYDAKIYQYVGDQVVLHWNITNGLRNNNCIHCFYGFLDRLEKRKAYYQSRYQLLPFFKASAHVGSVTVAEVGLLKREIAFHGDTVNTTSRIHDYCNKFQQRLLISRDLHDMLEPDKTLEYIYIGDHVLKGKHMTMELYGVKRVGAPTPVVKMQQADQPDEPPQEVTAAFSA